MAHLKRQEVPKNWPIKRKGTTFVVRPNFSANKGLPILIILRDILKIARNRKEAKRAIHEKNVLHNNKFIRDEKKSAVLMDVIKIIPSKKNYRIVLNNYGKFGLEEIKESEANMKVAKVVDKKTLRGKKQQINLGYGVNFISDSKCNVNDSVLINFKDRKIEKVLPLKEKSKIIIFAGKHAGKKGIIKKIKSERKMVSIEVSGKDINVLIKQIMVVE
ncbi:MAG: hypothetical protein ABH811_02430 [archaeon]